MQTPAYKVNDWVILTQKFVVDLTHIKRKKTQPYLAKIVEVKPTVSLGPCYVIEINGERQKLCYWETDIERRFDRNANEDLLWQTWGDK